MLDFLSHKICLVGTSIVLVATILINLGVGVLLILPGLMVSAIGSEGENPSLIDFVSNRTGLMSALLLLSCAALYVALNILRPSRFLPREINSLLVVPFFPAGITCALAGLFSFYAVGAQLFISFPNLLSAVICFFYVPSQYKA